MSNRSTVAEIQATNNRVYEDLMASLETAGDHLDLLIAVCDDAQVQEEVIAGYEAELTGQGITPFTLSLQRGAPSLRTGLRSLVKQEPHLQAKKPAVITVLGADKLSTLALPGEQRSEQDIFFGYLQLTRDGLPEFPLSIVLWVSHQVAKQLATQAPDFWSWRGGVFWFESYRKVTVSTGEIAQLISFLNQHLALNGETDNQYLLPINDLQQLVEQVEHKNENNQALGFIYFQLGEVYRLRCKNGKVTHLENEIELAEKAYRKSLKIDTQSNNSQNIAAIYNSLGLLHEAHSRYREAISDYQTSIDWNDRNPDQWNKSRGLKNLGNAYRKLGEYAKAAELYQQSIEIAQEVGDRQTEGRALNTLGLVNLDLEQYDKSIDLFQKSIDIAKALGNIQDEGHVLGNLGMAYRKIGQPEKAIELYKEYISIAQKVGDRQGEVDVLCNLGNVSGDLGQHGKAIEFYRQSMQIAEGIGDRQGIGDALGNLGRAFSFLGQNTKAVDFYRQALSISQEIGDRYSEANSYLNLGSSLQKLHRGYESIEAYEKAAHIYDELGLMHKVTKLRNIISTAEIDNLRSASMTAPEIVPGRPKSSAVGRLVKRFRQNIQHLGQWLRRIL